ncbi:MAG: hypothetical protein QGI33_06940, partial [Candidatus Brocadiia bacterium]|nr:hypothetical protein [Candidatus Brocadiia bacterium]
PQALPNSPEREEEGQESEEALDQEALDELVAAGPHLIHAHIGEPGRHCPQTTPDEHAAFLRTLRAAGYDGRVTQTGALPAYAAPTLAATALKKAAGS